MKRLTWVYLALLGGAVAMGFMQEPESEWLTPSVRNPGPEGLAVLTTWLSEAGADVRIGTDPLTALPPGVATVVLAAPTAREVSDEEIKSLERFVERGGTLVYLAGALGSQVQLARWLKLETGSPLPLVEDPSLADLSGATLTVLQPKGLLTGVKQLRVQAELSVRVTRPETLQVSQPAGLWYRPLGDGEVWIAPNAGLAQSGRLMLLDNARFWQNLASRGPLLFDEHHHEAPPAAPLPLNLLGTLAQLAFIGLIFLAGYAQRLGPARPAVRTVHHDSLEAARATARLTQRPELERELTEAVRREAMESLRALTHAPPTLPFHEVAARASARLGVPITELAKLETMDDFLELSRAVATLEQAIGQAPATSW